jgi:hypothetical protein
MTSSKFAKSGEVVNADRELQAARTAKRNTELRFGRTVSLLTRWKPLEHS